MKINELKKKQYIAPDPYEEAMKNLEWYKERGIKSIPNGTLQLFVPRKMEIYRTRKEKEDYILRDRAKYAYDDEGNLKPEFQQWVDTVTEGAPIIAGSNPIPGDTKPRGALIWTSTAKKLDNGKWTSEWNKFIQGRNAGGTPGKIGYLYKIKPNTLVYELDSSNDARIIYDIFANLGRANTAKNDPELIKKETEFYKSFSGSYDEIEMSLIKKDFPWQEIAKHFDCIHHWGYRSSSFNYSDFTSGYDVESSAWFKPNQLEFLGQVPLWTAADEIEDDY